MSSIKAAAILRMSDLQILYQKSFNKKDIENDLQMVLKHVESINARPEERVSLKTSNGRWNFKMDDSRTAYVVLSSETYPERQIYAMIKEMEKEFKKIPDFQIANSNEIEKQVRYWMKDLHEKYDNLSGIDKVAQAQAQMDSVQQVMEENIHIMVNNNGQLDGLDEKADKMKQQSQAFHSQATDLARIMYWRNMKLKILIGLIILGVLLYIIVPLIISAQN